MTNLRAELEQAAIEAGDFEYARAIRTMKFDQEAFLRRLRFYTC